MIVVQYRTGAKLFEHATKVVNRGGARHLTDGDGNWIHTVYDKRTAITSDLADTAGDDGLDLLNDIMTGKRKFKGE